MTGSPRKYPNPLESSGQLLELIRMTDGVTRSDLVELTGLSRSTVAQRIDLLVSHDLIREAGEAPSTGGRPPSIIRFNGDAGVVLVADLGATHARFAVTNLAAEVLAEEGIDLLISAGPDHVLGMTLDIFEKLLIQSGRTGADVKGIGIGVPGPIDFAAGRPSDPPIMPGWHDYPVGDRFTDRFGVPVLVDNDVNIMALGEFWMSDPRPSDMVFIKVGTGIGCGIIIDGHAHRGAKGAAGDVGHIRIGRSDVICRCGNTGCLEAIAGGGALAASLAEAGHKTTNARDVVNLAATGNPDAVLALREAGRAIGGMLAGVVNLMNPSVIVIGGDVAQAGQSLLAGIREAVYRRSTTLNTSNLLIRGSELGDRAGVIGAAVLVIERILDPAVVDEDIQSRIGAVA